MRIAIAFVLGFGALGCGDKQGPPPAPLDKRGIQERSDRVHDDLKDEEDRDKRRKQDN